MLVLLSLCLVGCGSGGHVDPFARCGNGVLDSGEQCDDGPTNDDGGACLSTCVKATCGDALIWKGVEQCDGINITGCGGQACRCQDIGFSAGTLSCAPSCTFDTSQCGPAFTPTATPTVTPTPPGTSTMTPTASATPTPTPTAVAHCGNHLLEEVSGETCDTCPQDCTVQACNPAVPTVTVSVTLTTPDGQAPSNVGVRVAYRWDVVSLPGTGTAASVASRVHNRPPNSIPSIADLDYLLRVSLRRTNPPISPGRLFTVDFDPCAAAGVVLPSDFGCVVDTCESGSSPVTGCGCTVGIP